MELEVRSLTMMGIVIRIGLATLLGGLIGFERGMKNRPAGLRTYMLVCLGSCMVMMTNQYIYQFYGAGDISRMGAQVVSGIGFLGAGTIIVTQRNQIKGLTTAAGLWASGCLGLAIGIGFYEVALIGGLAMFMILTALHTLDFRMRKKARLVEAYIELSSQANMAEFVGELRKRKITPSNIQLLYDTTPDNQVIAFSVTLKARDKKKSHEYIIDKVKEVESVYFIEEL